jgi:hypothetical protein
MKEETSTSLCRPDLHSELGTGSPFIEPDLRVSTAAEAIYVKYAHRYLNDIEREKVQKRRICEIFQSSVRSKILTKKCINIETRRSTTPEKRVILVQGPC